MSQVFRVALLCFTLAAVASAGVAAQSAGITDAEITETVDGDGDDANSRAVVELTLDTECRGCYDGDGLTQDPAMEPVVRISVGDETETFGDLPTREDHTLQYELRGEDIVDDSEDLTVTATLVDDDLVGEDRVDRETLDVRLEPIANDVTPTSDRTFAYELENLTRCGTFCGEATAVLRNDADSNHSDIRITVEALTNETTLREDRHTVSRLAPGETDRVRQRIELDPIEVYRVQRNDREITIRIVTRYDDGAEVLIDQVEVG
jgi:hypothetical protein